MVSAFCFGGAMEETQEDQAKPRTRILENGAVYDIDKGRIVANPGGGKYAITAQNSSAYHARRQEIKQQKLLEGAAKHLQKASKSVELPSDMQVVEAIGTAVMEKALDPKSVKQVDAARFILQESGLAESQQQPAQPGSVHALLGAAVLEYIRRQISSVSEIAISATNNTAHSSADSEVIDVSPTSQDPNG